MNDRVTRPNILILMADQLTARALPAYGNAVARTPHIDALAAGGVVFEHAYCNSPLCAPSWAVFMSGLLPPTTGCYDNATEFPSQLPTFVHVLRHAGYRTVLAGEMHFCGPDQMHGFEERLTTDIYPADYGWTPDWTRPEARPESYHNMDSVTQAGPCVRTNQMDFDEEVGWAAQQKLHDIARGSDRRPFCMVVSMTHPHDPFTIPGRYWDRFSDAEIDMPRVAEPARDPHALRLRHVCGMDAQPVTARHVRDARHAYYGAISYFDDQVGALVDALRATRMGGDTVVVVLADHGEFLGKRGLFYKMSFLEPACRIPLIVQAPQRFAAARVTGGVSLVDMLPTMAELGGAEVATPLDGTSLMPMLRGEPGRDVVPGEYLAEGTVAPMVMIHPAGRKYIHAEGDPDRLFDLAADPEELVNLGATGAAAAWVAEAARRWDLSRLLAEVLASQRRRRFVAEALAQGGPSAWDYQPVRDARQMYVRSHMKLDEIEAMARFPRVTRVPQL